MGTEFLEEDSRESNSYSGSGLARFVGTQVSGVLDVDWLQSASVAVLAALSSVLMSIIATGVGDHESPSFVSD